jgi:hypothetical protein
MNLIENDSLATKNKNRRSGIGLTGIEREQNSDKEFLGIEPLLSEYMHALRLVFLES